MKIGILGYGSVGQKLAKIFSDAGHEVNIGLRDTSDAKKNDQVPYATYSFAEAAEKADALALAIPYLAALEVLKGLAPMLIGKMIIDNTNPLNADWSPLLLGQENSAGEEIQRALPQSFVVKAFNTIFADVMPKEAHSRDGHKITAFIAGNDEHAKGKIIELADVCGFLPLNVGNITSARYLEAMAHLNIHIALALGGGTNAAFLYHQAQDR